MNPLHYPVSRDGLPASTPPTPQRRVACLRSRRAGTRTVWGRLPAPVEETSRAPGEKPLATFSSIADLSGPRKPPGGSSDWRGSKLRAPVSVRVRVQRSSWHSYKSH